MILYKCFLDRARGEAVGYACGDGLRRRRLLLLFIISNLYVLNIFTTYSILKKHSQRTVGLTEGMSQKKNQLTAVSPPSYPHKLERRKTKAKKLKARGTAGKYATQGTWK